MIYVHAHKQYAKYIFSENGYRAHFVIAQEVKMENTESPASQMQMLVLS